MCVPDEYFLDGKYDCADLTDENQSFSDSECAFVEASYECDDRIGLVVMNSALEIGLIFSSMISLLIVTVFVNNIICVKRISIDRRISLFRQMCLFRRYRKKLSVQKRFLLYR